MTTLMATPKKTTVVIRLSFGQSNVKGRQKLLETGEGKSTYRYVVRRLAIGFAEDKYEEIRDGIIHQVQEDVRRELVNLASLYRRHIIGANGTIDQPAGVIHSVFGGVPPLTLRAALPSWAPRDAKYLSRKKFNRAGNGWFDNRGWTGAGAPKDSGLLFKEMRAETWETMFGPISVVFHRDNKALEPKSAFGNISTHQQVQIGTLRVYALGRLTPAMLPALRTNSISVASDQGNPGLMQLVENYDKRLAYRLGQRSTITKKYRPTLEPFLEYFLVRSIPAAVERRMTEGKLGRITRST